jgi:hypothetical protein
MPDLDVDALRGQVPHQPDDRLVDAIGTVRFVVADVGDQHRGARIRSCARPNGVVESTPTRPAIAAGRKGKRRQGENGSL